MTVVVTDLTEAKSFFGALGFVERTAVIVSGEEMSRYMGIDEWEADHVTLVLEDGIIHQEVQLLYFHRPQVIVDSTAGTLDRTGFNHVCFRVKDLDEVLSTLAGHGFRPGMRSWNSTIGGLCSSMGPASSSNWPNGSPRRAGSQGRQRKSGTRCDTSRAGTATSSAVLAAVFLWTR